ncbi:NAD-dependent epimerase/dehydratase family protein [Nocardia suismassiliense]|uniref:NAD-dependent epimerase/dehydratase family protein n=1 Tax=Nocardia suismassiliense TaxID=2077092 RepID=UPI000D1F7845|nr:NAD(P)-dependent oxidoreductase [Nocardia suismassiliense]
MSGRTILVTGGTGVIGAWAVREIAEAGDTPVILTRGSTGVGRAILGEHADKLVQVHADLTNPLALADAVHRYRPTVIAHLASAKPWQMDAGYVAHLDPALGVRTIIDGTTNILEIARTFGVHRVVYASSKSAYAPFTGPHGAPDYRPVREDYRREPTEIYGITKLAAEQLGDYYREHLGVDVIALRFASTYGPFKRGAGTAPAGLIANAIDGVATRANFGRRAYTEQLDEFVYNRDVGRAIRLACTVESTTDSVFNIGTGIGSSVRDVVEAIRAVPEVTAPEITVEPDSPANARAHLVQSHAGVLDGSAAAAQLGFTAAYDLVAGIRDAAEVVRAARTEVPA